MICVTLKREIRLMSQNVTQTELVNSITNHAYKNIFRWKKEEKYFQIE